MRNGAARIISPRRFCFYVCSVNIHPPPLIPINGGDRGGPLERSLSVQSEEAFVLGKGIAIGAAGVVGIYLIWRYGPAIGRAAEPAVRSAVKANVIALQKAREAYARFSEVAEDAYAEAWADLNREAAAQEAAAATVEEPQPA